MKHCLIKMYNGDDVVGRFVEEDDNTLMIEDAMVVDVSQHEEGTSIYVTRWAPFTDDKLIMINKTSVVSVLNLRKAMAEYYEQCVESYYKRFEADFDEQLSSSETVENEEELLDSDELDRYIEQLEQTVDTKATANTTLH